MIACIMLNFLAAVRAVLFVACVNIANMLLARPALRVREFSIRVGPGGPAGPARPPALAESRMLAFGGGLLGVLAARWALDLVSRARSSSCLFAQGELDLNLAVLGYAFLVSLSSAIILRPWLPYSYLENLSGEYVKKGGQAAFRRPVAAPHAERPDHRPASHRAAAVHLQRAGAQTCSRL